MVAGESWIAYRFATRRELTALPDAMYSVTTANKIRRWRSSNVTVTFDTK